MDYRKRVKRFSVPSHGGMVAFSLDHVYKKKSDAMHCAATKRKNGHNARVVKQGIGYASYSRRYK